eukprot:SAG22_NODE_300_length_12752_cov_3.102426_3_plen_103_part_00
MAAFTTLCVCAVARGASLKPTHFCRSYQWDVQDRVVSIRNELMAKGIQCWMDIDGDNGMGMDLYESMADGVSNAAVVVVCLTAAYAESTNCKLEIKVRAATP